MKNPLNFKLFLQEIHFKNSWFFRIFVGLKLGSFKKLKLYGGQTINFSIFLSCRVISSSHKEICVHGETGSQDHAILAQFQAGEVYSKGMYDRLVSFTNVSKAHCN